MPSGTDTLQELGSDLQAGQDHETPKRGLLSRLDKSDDQPETIRSTRKETIDKAKKELYNFLRLLLSYKSQLDSVAQRKDISDLQLPTLNRVVEVINNDSIIAFFTELDELAKVEKNDDKGAKFLLQRTHFNIDAFLQSLNEIEVNKREFNSERAQKLVADAKHIVEVLSLLNYAFQRALDKISKTQVDTAPLKSKLL